MTCVRTVVLSDLHLGSPTRNDVLRVPEPRQVLLEAIEGADRLVLLGDVVELRGAPVSVALRRARDALAAIGEAAADAEVLVVPGNHDHQLAAEWLERRRQREGGAPPLTLEHHARPGRSGLLAKVAGAMGVRRLELAYPGAWLRPDVYATHGHWLDCHNPIPAVEVLAVSAVSRASGGPRSGPTTPDGYESATGPVYAFNYSIAQGGGPSRGALKAGSSLRVWRRLNPHDGRVTPSRVLLGGVLIPGAIAALNRAGLGPFSADLSPAALRVAALRAMGEVVDRLGIEAQHVLFGHTHRAGPLPGDRDEEGWVLPDGRRLWNSGNWVYEPTLIGPRARRSGHWPGSTIVLDDGDPPRLERPLADLPAERLHDAARATGARAAADASLERR